MEERGWAHVEGCLRQLDAAYPSGMKTHLASAPMDMRAGWTACCHVWRLSLARRNAMWRIALPMLGAVGLMEHWHGRTERIKWDARTNTKSAIRVLLRV